MFLKKILRHHVRVLHLVPYSEYVLMLKELFFLLMSIIAAMPLHRYCKHIFLLQKENNCFFFNRNTLLSRNALVRARLYVQSLSTCKPTMCHRQHFIRALYSERST